MSKQSITSKAVKSKIRQKQTAWKMKRDQSNSIQLLKNSISDNKEDKKGENAHEVLRRLRIQNTKLLQEVLNLKGKLKEFRSENKQMKKHVDDWMKLKKLILQSAWKY